MYLKSKIAKSLGRFYAEHKFIVSGRKNPRTGGVILVRNVDGNC